MYKIAIIGSGQLGSRHLQSLAALDVEAHIFLVDPSIGSLEKAQLIFENANPGSLLHLSVFTSIELIGESFLDVVIVATNSLVRREVIEMLVKTCKVKYLVLEKFLFPQIEDYNTIQQLIETHKIRTWVNCPRRMYPVYQQIKELLKGSCHFSIKGSNWGLGCNGIHMLDLAAYISGEEDFVLNDELLDEEIQASKRDGYIEFSGTITGYSKNKKHTLLFSSYTEEQIPFSISINNGLKQINIVESLKKMSITDLATQSNEIQSIDIFFQSQLTSKVVNDLLKNGNCELTGYHESSKLHLAVLECLLKKLNNNSSTRIEKCPVT